MKLATLKSQSRDGELLVVKRDLTYAVKATDIAPNLQYALDHWSQCEAKLQHLYQQLNDDLLNERFEFEASAVAAPLPRAYQWADGSAYVNHVELVRKARGATMPENFWHDPLMYQGGSDNFIGPCDDIKVLDPAWGIDFEAEVAVITGDVSMGTAAADAASSIRLLMLVNDVSLRNLIPNELSKGFGFFHSKPASSFSPVAVTVDELAGAWQDCKVQLPLQSYLNDELFGQPHAGTDMTFNFAELIAHAAKTRDLAAGTIIGSGTVSNQDRSLGSSCIAERRMLEKIETGTAETSFMQYQDTIKIQMLDENNQSIFGAIEQTVVAS